MANNSDSSSSTPEEAFHTLIQRNRHAGGAVSESEVEAIYDALRPVRPSFLIGEWEGGSLDTGHPGHKSLAAMRWAGKNFRSVDDVDPIVVLDDGGKRVWKEDWGSAVLREMVFRGVTSTAMIYDTRPIFDHFRYVSEDMVLGAMECPKVKGPVGTYYFFLTRRKE